MVHGKDREESIKLTAEAYGISEVDAAEIVDIELGLSQGDDILESVDDAEPEKTVGTSANTR